MESKSSKTIWTLVIAAIILLLSVIIFMNFWKIILGLGIGFVIGFYFGWTKGREKKR